MREIVDEPMHLAFCVDDHFCQHLAALVVTLQQHCQRPIHAHLLSGHLSDANLKALNSMSTPSFSWSCYTVTADDFSALPISLRYGERLTNATYYRMALPDLLAPHIKKVLYLDADMLVLGDISPLWDCDCQNVAATVVADGSLSYQKRWEVIGSDNPHYFNAGMMLINLDKWRIEDLAAMTLSFLNESQDWEYNDQDLLNLALNDCVQYVDEKWNAQSFHFRQDKDITPMLVHFTGVEKPWHISSNHPLRQLYIEARRFSPYNEFSLELYLDIFDENLLNDIQNTIMGKASVVIYGAGQRGRRIYHAIKSKMPFVTVIAFIDKYEQEQYECLEVNFGLPDKEFDFVILSSEAYQEEIITQLMAWQVPADKIIGTTVSSAKQC
jgi:lipopolysaccharide biosynthesis glycosyltransferase